MISCLLAIGLLGPGKAVGQNVLLLLADDVGVDRIGAYAEHPKPGRTPIIDGLAAQGVLFRSAWSNPTCSPSRAAILTGRHAFRTGVGRAIPPDGTQSGLSLADLTLPEALDLGADSRVRCAFVGKWHLVGDPNDGTHPLASGFPTYAGALFNLTNYFDWPKQIGRQSTISTAYATTDTTDDAIAAIRQLPEPWFVYVSYNAAHAPFHLPPQSLHTFGFPVDPVKRYKAMVEAMDTEIGRLLASLPGSVRARTTVVFAGDNGTPPSVTTAPFDPSHAKFTVYEGGVRIPLIIQGPGVADGAECRALVGLVDLFATVAELCGAVGADVSSAGVDSISLVPYLSDPARPSLREYLYTEGFGPNGPAPYRFHDRAIRDDRWKLIQRDPGCVRELYDLASDPFETNDLGVASLSAEAEHAYRRLSEKLHEFR